MARSRAPGRAIGFTLVELVVTFTLLLILSLFAGPILSDFGFARIATAQVRVASAIRYAQELSMTTHRVHGVSFDLPSNKFTVYENANPNDPTRNPATSSDYVIPLGSGHMLGVTIQSASFGAQAKVEFGTDGSPVAGGSVVLAHSSAGTRTVAVSASTGLTTP